MADDYERYVHADKRLNNPPVGLVTPATDGVEEKKKYAYDPHIAPSLEFDSGRAAVDKVIDEALTSDDPEVMKAALEELKRASGPFLNWTGKAERTSFEVPTVSLHVHERIDTAAILEHARKPRSAAPIQGDLFENPFPEPPLREDIEFYRHERGWANRLIAGDSLLVMNSLLVKEGMAGKVQMIYLDPPYGIKYGSNFQPFVNKRDVKDGKDEDLNQEPEMIKAFRDTWELGIHSYLTYLRDRLLLARELLHESGSCFVQISDENLHLVRNLMDEVFGTENFISQIIFSTTRGFATKLLSRTGDLIIWYSRDTKRCKYRPLSRERSRRVDDDNFRFVQLADGSIRAITESERVDIGNLPQGARLFRLSDTTSQDPASEAEPFEFNGQTYLPPKGRHWTVGLGGMQRLASLGVLVASGNTISYRRSYDDLPTERLTNVWNDTVKSGFGEKKAFVVQTLSSVIERCLLLTTDPGDLVFDPTCGSGTTAYVAEKWGRRWITCDTSRVAVTLARQRLMTAGFDYFPLKYPQEGVKSGFIYKTVPHVTLKSIANNPEIDEIYERDHPKIEAALAALNTAIKQDLKEWEVSFDFRPDWPAVAHEPFDAFHATRLAMQKRMDDSIARNAGQETLYNQPKVDKKKTRVTGPFTVEAVPFPTVLSLDETEHSAEATNAVARSGESARHYRWNDELLASGIRGKNGRIYKFAELITLVGTRYLHAVGILDDSGERVAVSFGPEFAALEQRQVALALEEAGILRPTPKYIVFAAFSFDPEAAKDIDETNWPGVTLLKAQMNADLLTDDLKKKRSSNESFWLIGQPEISIGKTGNDEWRVEVHGFDYFDMAKGEIRSGGKRNIAVWLLDTDYNGRSLLPAQVFFPMAGEKDGWSRLAKNLKAVLDESRIEAFHGTLSLPFKAGKYRRVAVKIVDDRGIESLVVKELS